MRTSSASFVTLTQSWVTVVSSIASLTPELLESSSPTSEKYSSEDDEMFWSLVHQGYSAKFSPPSQAEDAQTLRQQWEMVRPSVAEFDKVLSEMCPYESAKTLDQLPAHDHRKLLKQVLTSYEERTGERFKYLDVWNLLTHHGKWERVLKPLVLRGEAEKAAPPATGGLSRLVGTQVLAGNKRQRKYHDQGELVSDAGFGGANSDAENCANLANAEGSADSLRQSTLKGASESRRRKQTPKRVVLEEDVLDHVNHDVGRPVLPKANAASADQLVAEEGTRAAVIKSVETTSGVSISTEARVSKTQCISESKRSLTDGYMRSSSGAEFRMLLQQNKDNEKKNTPPERVAFIPSEDATPELSPPRDLEIGAPEAKPHEVKHTLDDVNLALAWID